MLGLNCFENKKELLKKACINEEIVEQYMNNKQLCWAIITALFVLFCND